MQELLTDDELAELEAEVRQMSVWALDEADVRRLQLHRRSLEQLRLLRSEVAEARISEASAGLQAARAQPHDRAESLGRLPHRVLPDLRFQGRRGPAALSDGAGQVALTALFVVVDEPVGRRVVRSHRLLAFQLRLDAL